MMSDKTVLVTVFTPTYNRANTIQRTFESLCSQTCKDFEWLIVDDGSTDGTQELIEKFRRDATFAIVYKKKKNGGKHTAHNEALKLAKGKLFFTVDSDDWLPLNSIETIARYSDQLLNDNNERLGGIIALKKDQDDKIIGRDFSSVHEPTNLYQLENEGLGGERSIVFITEVIKQYPFEIIPNEKFMGECIVYDKIGSKYNFKVLNISLTICEYQNNGLSSSPKLLVLNNPGGYKLYFKNRIDMACSMKERMNYILHYIVMDKLYKGNFIENVYKGKYLWIIKILNPLGYILKFIYKRDLNG